MNTTELTTDSHITKKDYNLEETLLKVENVNLKYGDKQILRDINVEIKNVTRVGVEQGQVVALVGRSGIGKTQLFRILAGLNKPTCGTVKIGENLHVVHPGEVGIIPQDYILFNHRTVYQNLLCGIKHCGHHHTDKEMKDVIHKYAEDFNLIEHLSKYPMQLSGGQRQRVSIIQQVLTDNKFILLDEPFSGLDSKMVDKVIDLLLKVSTLNEFNTLIIISHDLESSMAISDLVWILAIEQEKEGATITKQYDLKQMGLAWEPNIRQLPAFQQLVEEIKCQF
jgi:ABC-type nitrate/sulfonate/bicarbonate transport system ATPase subunit